MGDCFGVVERVNSEYWEELVFGKVRWGKETVMAP